MDRQATCFHTGIGLLAWCLFLKENVAMTGRTETALALALGIGVFVPVCARAQWTLTKEQMTAYTAMNPYERFPDGRPKVPDALLERVKALVIEEAWGAVRQGCNAGRGGGGNAGGGRGANAVRGGSGN